MTVVFPYVRNTTWADGSGGGTSIDAADLNKIEDGIFNAHQQPAVRVTHNTTQAITTGTDTALAFNSERFDQAGGAASTQHDTVTNNGRLTCLYAGIYMITANVIFAANATGHRYLFLCLNGIVTQIGRVAQPGSATENALSTSCIYSLAVNDFVQVAVHQTSGGNLNIQSVANSSPEFMMVRVA